MPTLGPNISAHRFFPDMRFVAVNSKYSLVSHIYSSRGYLISRSNPIKNELTLTIWVPVGDCPSLTFSLLAKVFAKVFAKGKMFCYSKDIEIFRQSRKFIGQTPILPFFAVYHNKWSELDILHLKNLIFITVTYNLLWMMEKIQYFWNIFIIS